MRNLRLFHGDNVIWLIFFCFLAISLVEVYSAASTLTYNSGSIAMPFLTHACFIVVGIVVAWSFHNVPCRFFKFFPVLAIPASIILLIVVLLMSSAVNDAKRWIPLGSLSFQPSELAKGAVVAGIALVLSFMQTEKGADRHTMKYILWISLPICVLIGLENVSTAVIIFFVTVLMMFIGRVPLTQIGKLFGVLIILGISGLLLVKALPESITQKGMLHRLATVEGRIERFIAGGKDSTRTTKQLMLEEPQRAHANAAIATSNILGKMPGNSIERDFLSQAFSDFIYAIIIEEMGLVGGVGVLFLYIMLFLRCIRIANQCERNFPAFLVLGISILLLCQAIVNICVAVDLLPITGQPLPFISKGGTSTLINCMYIGMILSVSRFAKRREVAAKPQVVRTQANEAEFHSDEGIE